jgi:hypothetical protein
MLRQQPLVAGLIVVVTGLVACSSGAHQPHATARPKPTSRATRLPPARDGVKTLETQGLWEEDFGRLDEDITDAINAFQWGRGLIDASYAAKLLATDIACRANCDPAASDFCQPGRLRNRRTRILQRNA